MGISTCSGAISFSRELETESARFYEELAKRFDSDKDFLLGLAKENAKFTQQIERAYYGVITDALEGCFAFDLDTTEFKVEGPAPGSDYKAALAEALRMEEMIIRFYQVAAEQSKHLMADVPRAFTLVSKKRGDRLAKIKALAEG